jgi:hypothetical protein
VFIKNKCPFLNELNVEEDSIRGDLINLFILLFGEE